MCCVTASHAKHHEFDSRPPHICRDWWFSPGEHGYSDLAGNPGLYNLVELEMAYHCIGP